MPEGHAVIVPNDHLREWFDCALLRNRTLRTHYRTPLSYIQPCTRAATEWCRRQAPSLPRRDGPREGWQVDPPSCSVRAGPRWGSARDGLRLEREEKGLSRSLPRSTHGPPRRRDGKRSRRERCLVPPCARTAVSLQYMLYVPYDVAREASGRTSRVARIFCSETGPTAIGERPSSGESRIEP